MKMKGICARERYRNGEWDLQLTRWTSLCHHHGMSFYFYYLFKTFFFLHFASVCDNAKTSGFKKIKIFVLNFMKYFFARIRSLSLMQFANDVWVRRDLFVWNQISNKIMHNIGGVIVAAACSFSRENPIFSQHLC